MRTGLDHCGRERRDAAGRGRGHRRQRYRRLARRNVTPAIRVRQEMPTRSVIPAGGAPGPLALIAPSASRACEVRAAGQSPGRSSGVPQMRLARPTDKSAVARVADARCDWMETRSLPSWRGARDDDLMAQCDKPEGDVWSSMTGRGMMRQTEDSPASTARSPGSRSSRRTCRRSTATWCRSTRTSTALARSPRATRMINCSTWLRIRYPSERIMTGSMPPAADPMAGKTAFHGPWPSFRTVQARTLAG